MKDLKRRLLTDENGATEFFTQQRLITIAKHALTKMEKTPMKPMRTALSISGAGDAKEVVREILDVESTDARHKLLRARWTTDTMQKDSSFIVHHAMLTVARKPKVRNCFRESDAYQSVCSAIGMDVENALARSGTQRTFENIHEAWRVASIRWRQQQKIFGLEPFGDIREISYQMSHSINFVQTRGDCVLGRQLIAWALANSLRRLHRCMACRKSGSAPVCITSFCCQIP